MDTAKVRDVMTSNVVAVRERTGYKEIVEVLVGFKVSAVPVLDAEYRVVGIVSEADLLSKAEFADEHVQAPLFERRRRRVAREKAAGETASELMTSPAITTGPEASVVEAARLMAAERVKRLPVVGDQGRLIGIVARSTGAAPPRSRSDSRAPLAVWSTWWTSWPTSTTTRRTCTASTSSARRRDARSVSR